MNLQAKITNISNGKTIVMDHGEAAGFIEAARSARLTCNILEVIIREKVQYTWIKRSLFSRKPLLFSIELTRKQVNKAIWRLEHATAGQKYGLMDALKDEIKPLK